MANEKFKAACQSVSEALYKSYTIPTRGLSSAALAKEEGRKLHPASFYYAVTSGRRKPTSLQVTIGSDFIHLRTMLRWTSKVSLGFGEDVKKKLCFLSEVVPDGTVK